MGVFGGSGPKQLEPSPIPKPGQHDLRKVRALHERIIELHLAGLQKTEIAATLGVTVPTVGNCLGSQIVRDRLAGFHDQQRAEMLDIVEIMKDSAYRGAELINNVIHGEGEGEDADLALRTKLSMDQLSRVGFAPVTKVADVTPRYLTPERVESLLERAKAKGYLVPAIVQDAEFSEVEA